MGPLAIALGLSAVAVLVFTMLTNRPHERHPDAVGAALAQVGVWSAAMGSQALLSPPDSMMIGPVVDAMLAVWMAYAWFTHRERWKLVFLAFLGVEALAHVVFQTEYRGEGVLYRYVLVLNLSFLAQLACVATPGAAYVADRIGRALRDYRDQMPHVGMGS